MENFDGRKLTHNKREEIPIKAPKRVEAGESLGSCKSSQFS
jgi:hypothetical protein